MGRQACANDGKGASVKMQIFKEKEKLRQYFLCPLQIFYNIPVTTANGNGYAINLHHFGIVRFNFAERNDKRPVYAFKEMDR